MHCDIYKSSKKDEMYIYVPCTDSADHSLTEKDPLENVPEGICQVFGRPTFVMHLELSQSRKLARVNVLHVLDSLKNTGFFIQMPPEGFINPTDEPEGLRGA